MSDADKHYALIAQGFSIAKVCGNCKHWRLENSKQIGRWGRCAIALYTHAKHTGVKEAGTPTLGTCERHEWDPQRAHGLVGSDDYTSRYLPDEAC